MILWLRYSNIVLFFAACALLASGLALELRIEVGDEGRRLLGLNGEAWGEVHFLLGLGVAALVVLHLVLNWAWLKALVSRVGWPIYVCLALGLGLIAVVLLAPVTGSAHRERGGNDTSRGD